MDAAVCCQSPPCAVIRALDDCVNSCHILVLLYLLGLPRVWAFAPPVLPLFWWPWIRLYTGLVIRVVSWFTIGVDAIHPHPLSRWFRCLVGSTPTLPIVDVMTGHCPPTVLEPVPRTICHCNSWQPLSDSGDGQVSHSSGVMLRVAVRLFILLLKQLVIH